MMFTKQKRKRNYKYKKNRCHWANNNLVTGAYTN